mmetsp:Transcript_35640/g.54518  ORF Transcript_35640/g.54518 Transcript_35640/m.54518 type:complete len:95 (+) Transcript_35640:1777-2061(+)
MMKASINSDEPPSFKQNSVLAAIAEEQGVPAMSLHDEENKIAEESGEESSSCDLAANKTKHALFASQDRLHQISESSNKSIKQLHKERDIEVVE